MKKYNPRAKTWGCAKRIHAVSILLLYWQIPHTCSSTSRVGNTGRTAAAVHRYVKTSSTTVNGYTDSNAAAISKTMLISKITYHKWIALYWAVDLKFLGSIWFGQN